MLSEKILLMFSRKPDESDYKESKVEYTIDNALDILISAFGSHFLQDIKNKAVLDFGCGSGFQVVAMALKGATFVVGVDIREEVFKEGINLAKKHKVSNKVKFLTKITDEFFEYFDIIISQNSFEHYSDPEGIVELWKRLLKLKGKIYITFGPPWYAPYGAHMHFFTKIPWVNLFFSESTVMRVRTYFRSDGAKRYEEIEGGLNKMTVRKFEKIIKNSGLAAEYINYHAVKKIKFLTKIPIIRELFINHIDCILIKNK